MVVVLVESMIEIICSICVNISSLVDYVIGLVDIGVVVSWGISENVVSGMVAVCDSAVDLKDDIESKIVNSLVDLVTVDSPESISFENENSVEINFAKAAIAIIDFTNAFISSQNFRL